MPYLFYISQTGRKLKTRLAEHQKLIHSIDSKESAVAIHWKDTGHDVKRVTGRPYEITRKELYD